LASTLTVMQTEARHSMDPGDQTATLTAAVLNPIYEGLLSRAAPVRFMHYDLGYIDLEQRTLQTIDNPFGTRLSPMS